MNRLATDEDFKAKRIDWHAAYGINPIDRMPLKPESGWAIVPEGCVVGKSYRVWDIYAGWIKTDGHDARNQHRTRAKGRWRAWARKTTKKGTP